MNAAPIAERSREVRLGVVMFGGVSLAVYINGVSSELFRAVRGRGVYRLLKALTDSHVVVDILSGASAGGINSVFLSAALCNGTDFESTSTLWREHADMEPLLEPTQRARPIDNSVLNGDYHQTQLEAAFRTLLAPPSPSQEKEDPSPVGELDLFVTGTDINGQFEERLDALGHHIALENHRVLFQLKHRAGRKEPFSARAFQDGKPKAPDDQVSRDTNVSALATLSHITSCFPGAFEPMLVDSPTRAQLDRLPSALGTVDNRLSYWGQLAGQAVAGSDQPRRVTLMDGGVLKNKPFTSTIEAIFSRLADTQVSRYMLYIEPDPIEAVDARKAAAETNAQAATRLEPRSERQPAKGQDSPPHLLPVALAAASGLPRFESIEADLQLVDAHNEQVLRYESLLQAATEAAMSSALEGSSTSPAHEAYQRARLADIAGKVEDALNQRLPTPIGAARGEDPRFKGLVELVAQLDKRASLNELYAELDVLFRFRRLLNITYAVDDAGGVVLEAPSTPNQPHAQRQRRVAFSVPSAPGRLTHDHIERELLTTLNRQIELYEIVRDRLARELSELATTPRAKLDLGDPRAWQAIAERARAVLASLPQPACFDPNFPIDQLHSCVTAAELEALSERHDLASSAPLEGSAGRVGFLEAADKFEARLLSSSKLLLDLYQHFDQIDEVALPLALVSALRGRDPIQTVRVSPSDAKREFAGRFASKLCGVQLFDFGAFFKRSWRSNDLMWGRIDGSAQLLDILLDPKRIGQLGQPLLYANLVDTIGDKLDLSEIFPHAPLELRNTLQGWLHKLVSEDASVASAARDELLPLRSELRDLWARAVQLEILSEQLPGVLEDAAEEAQGSQQVELRSQARRLRTAPDEIDAYFYPERYTIAQQTLPADMPREKMLGLMAKAGKHLKDALEKSLPDSPSLFSSGLHATFGTLASAAIWALSRRWVANAKAREASER